MPLENHAPISLPSQTIRENLVYKFFLSNTRDAFTCKTKAGVEDLIQPEFCETDPLVMNLQACYTGVEVASHGSG